MQKWVVTGVSGSGRIDLLNNLQKEIEKRNKKAHVHDVGQIIKEECERNGLGFSDQFILDRDQSLLKSIRPVR